MPVWDKHGTRLYYLDLTQKLTAVDVQLGTDSVQIGKPATLFQTAVRSSIGGSGYDAARDGRFLLINSTTESSTPLTLLTNWDRLLKR